MRACLHSIKILFQYVERPSGKFFADLYGL
jgi:hypothetical protein